MPEKLTFGVRRVLPAPSPRHRRRGKYFTRLFFGIPLLAVVFYVPVALYATSSTTTSRRPEPIHLVTDNVGRGQCFDPSVINTTVPCAKCVPFVTVAVADTRWETSGTLSRALRVLTGTLRTSQHCFTLHVYTNIQRDSAAWEELADAGGVNTTIMEYPTDLPRNRYSYVDTWLELSRRKLDLLERHLRNIGEKAVWTDLDTLVVADIACAYSRSPRFVVSRHITNHTLVGPGGVSILIHPRRSVLGDFFMLDDELVRAVRKLEEEGMPPPALDLQDYFSVLMNRCDGFMVDLRALIRADGFMRGNPMCFGFDSSNGQHPTAETMNVSIIHDKLRCSLLRKNRVANRFVATISFTATTFWDMLEHPREIFNNAGLAQWASRRDIIR